MPIATKITTCDSMYSVDQWRATKTFAELFKATSHLEVPSKERTPCFSMAEFRDNRRKKRNVISVAGLVYDFDASNATPFDVAVSALREGNLTSYVYTTYSHLSDGKTPKYRVVIPFAEKVNEPKQRWYADFHAHIAASLGFVNYDITSNQLERMYFVASKPANSTVQHTSTFIDAEALVPDLSIQNVEASGIAPNHQNNRRTASGDALWITHDNQTVDVREWFDINSTVDIAQVINDNCPEIIISDRDSGGYHIRCPFEHEHSTQRDGDKACFAAPPNDEYCFATISCLHEHCNDRDTPTFIHRLLTDGTLSFDALSAAAPPNILDFPLSEVQVKENFVPDDTAVFKPIEYVDPAVASEYDADVFTQKVLSDAKWSKALFDCEDIPTFQELCKDRDLSDSDKLYALAFTAVPLTDALTHGVVARTDMLKAYRLQCRSLPSAVRRIITTQHFLTDYSKPITKLMDVYGLDYDTIADVFTGVRVEEFVDQAYAFTSTEHAKAYIDTFKALDKNMRRVNKSVVAKQALTGVLYVDMARTMNTIAPRVGVYNEEALVELHRGMRVFDARIENDVNVVSYWLRLPYIYPEIEAITCTPKHKFGSMPDLVTFNTYDPEANIKSIPCDMNEFYDKELALFKEVLACNDEDAFNYMLAWCAHTHQFTSKKLPTCMFFEGIQGAGKSVLIKAMFVEPHGDFGLAASAKREIFSNFNALLAGKHMVFYDEVSETLNFKDDGQLKYFITSDKIRIEPKGVDSVEIDSFHHLVMASNNHNVVVLDDHDRRLSYFVVNRKYSNAPTFWAEQIARVQDPVFIGKMKYFLRNFRPEDHGMNWQILSRPFENNERRRRITAPKDTVDYFLDGFLAGDSAVAVGATGALDTIVSKDTVSKIDGKYVINTRTIAGAHLAKRGKHVTNDVTTITRMTKFKEDAGIVIEDGYIYIPEEKVDK